VIAAAALKCMGGHIQGRLWPRDEADAAAIKASGRDPARILYTDDLVRGNDVSFCSLSVFSGVSLSL
jgi:fructose-1,6-bisphosphatase II